MGRLGKYIEEKASLFDKDPEYIIKDAKETNKFIVSKWTHGKEPRDVYTITKGKTSWTCTCPVRSSCKHISLVKEWIKEGKPNPIGDFDSEFKLWLVKKYDKK